MRSVLPDNLKRRLEMLELLQREDDWITIKEVSKKLNCSSRIVRDDIAVLNEKYVDFTIKTSQKGIRISFEENSGIESIYQYILNESVAFQLLEVLFFGKHRTVDQLTAELFISTSTLYRLVSKLNKALSEKYDFRISTKSFKLIGPEENIRYFYTEYFIEKYSSLVWPFESINEEAFEQFLLVFIDYTRTPVNFSNFRKLKITTAVNSIRMIQGYKVVLKNKDFSEVIYDLAAHKHSLLLINEKLNFPISLRAITQIFLPFVQKDFFLTYDRLMHRVEKDCKTRESFILLSNTLDSISAKINVPILDKKELMLNLYNSSHLHKTHMNLNFILFDEKKSFARSIETEYPFLFRYLYNNFVLYKKNIDDTYNEAMFHHFVHMLFIHWGNLIPELQKKSKSANVLVVSKSDYHHAVMMKEIIQYELPDQFTIDVYQKTNLSKSILEKLPVDVVIADFPLPKLSAPLCICVHSVPTKDDLTKIKQAIDKTNAENYALKIQQRRAFN